MCCFCLSYWIIFWSLYSKFFRFSLCFSSFFFFFIFTLLFFILWVFTHYIKNWNSFNYGTGFLLFATSVHRVYWDCICSQILSYYLQSTGTTIKIRLSVLCTKNWYRYKRNIEINIDGKVLTPAKIKFWMIFWYDIFWKWRYEDNCYFSKFNSQYDHLVINSKKRLKITQVLKSSCKFRILHFI